MLLCSLASVHASAMQWARLCDFLRASERDLSEEGILAAARAIGLPHSLSRRDGVTLGPSSSSLTKLLIVVMCARVDRFACAIENSQSEKWRQALAQKRFDLSMFELS